MRSAAPGVRRRSRRARLRAATVTVAALAAAASAVPAHAAAGTAGKRVRVFAVGPRFSLDWVDTRQHFRDKLFALADARLRTATAPPVQRGAGDVASRLLGPADPADPVASARDLVTLPEDLGLMAAFTGSRGALARTAPDLNTAILSLTASYAPVATHYAATFPSLLQRPFPPTRLLAVSMTDTFVRTGVETFAALADRLDAYLVAGVTLAQDWRVVCADKARYVPPPGAGPCAVESPDLVNQLRDPDEPDRTYAYEATTSKASTMALVFDPAGHLVAKTVKAYLTPVELPGQLDLVPGEVSGVQAIPTPVGRLGIVTSKDAWMPDVTAKLDAQGAEILVQPEFFVNDTIRTTGPWAPDNIQGAGFSDVLRHPSLRAMVLPQLTGNLFDFSADSQQAIAVKPTAGGPQGAQVGQPPAPGYAAVGRWAIPDTGEGTFAARRARLGAAGEAMLPGGPPCADPQVAGPCRGGQVEDVITADVRVGGTPQPVSVRARRAPKPFGRSRTVAASRRPQRNASLAARGRTVVAAFEQGGKVVVARSRDAGARWERPVAVPAPLAAGGPQWWPSVSVGPDGAVWVAWQDGRQVRVARTAAGGLTARGALRLGPATAVPGGDATRQWRPSVAATGAGAAYLAWIDERVRPGGEDLPQAALYGVRVSADAGATDAATSAPRLATPLRLDRVDLTAPLAASLDHAWAPSVAARGTHVLVTWVDFRTYDWDVAARESHDGGVTFERERAVNDTPATVEALEDTPRAALTPTGAPLVAYTDWRQDPGSAQVPSRLYDTWIAGLGRAPQQADDHGAAHVSTFAPSVAPVGAGDAVVAWQDAAAGPAQIRLARLRGGSDTDAATRGRAVRVDDGGADGAGRARPQVVVAGGRLVVAWEDERGGPSQVRVTSAPLRRLR